MRGWVSFSQLVTATRPIPAKLIESATVIRWPLSLAAGAEETIDYTIEFRW
jgi:hypothetical protein